jgi:carboxyl-terminal processing protease
MTFKRSFLISFSILLLILGSFASGYIWRDYQASQERFPVLEQAYSILAQKGLKEIPPGPAMEYGAIRGMLQVYQDPYTLFVEPVQHELESDALQGSFGGIGVNLVMDDDGYLVLFPFPEGPAAQAGIQDGDRLLAVGDLQLSPSSTLEQVQSAIRGTINEAVTLYVGRAPDYTPIEIKIVRERIPLHSVTWHLDPDERLIGVVKINLIAASTAEEIQHAFEDLQAQGAQRFVLDLRDNPGGLLTAAVDVARLFLREGVVMQQQYKGRGVETFRVEKPGPLVEAPVAILINHGSASAAEIIAGALQAHRRAVLVGEASYGKDTVQLVFDLQDQSSLHVTAARWWIPDLKEPLGGKGLQPDYPVLSNEQDAGLGAGPDVGPDKALQTAARILMQQ